MIEQVLMEYVKPIILVIGLIEMAKKYGNGNITRVGIMIMQLVFCLIAGVLVALQGWTEGFTSGLVVLMVTKWLILLSLTTLFYDFLLKKIKAIGKGK
jgi:hypothetical protein